MWMQNHMLSDKGGKGGNIPSALVLRVEGIFQQIRSQPYSIIRTSNMELGLTSTPTPSP